MSEKVDAGGITMAFGYRELHTGWHLVLASFIGLTLSIGPMVTYSFGIFAPEIMTEFGWTRTEVFRAFFAHNMGILVGAPLVGFLIDRAGARRVILLSVPLFAMLWAAIGVIGNSLLLFSLLLGLIPILAGGALPMSYSRIIVTHFDRQRGIALGLALAGVGVGAALIPLLSRHLIDLLGWRYTYLSLAALILVISLPNALFLLRARPNEQPEKSKRKPLTAPSRQYGCETCSSIFHRRIFWIMAAFILLTGFAITAVLVNLAPILHEGGLSKQSAAVVTSALGVAVIAGRILVGILLDRFFAAHVTAAIFIAPAAASWVLAGTPDLGLIYLSAILIGLAVGAEVDIMAYMVSRYFKAQNFGFLNGLMFSLFVAGGAFGPLTLGYLRDLQGDYQTALQLMAAVIAAAALLILLSPRRYTQR